MTQDPKVLADVLALIERAVKNEVNAAGFGAFVPQTLINQVCNKIVLEVTAAGYVVEKKK